MSHDIASAARTLNLPPSTLRSWVARGDLAFVRRIARGRSRLSFTTEDLFGLSLLRDLTAFGVAVRDASEFAERIITRAGAPPQDYAAIVKRGETPVLEIVPASSLALMHTESRLVVPLRALWREVTASNDDEHVDLDATASS